MEQWTSGVPVCCARILKTLKVFSSNPQICPEIKVQQAPMNLHHHPSNLLSHSGFVLCGCLQRHQRICSDIKLFAATFAFAICSDICICNYMHLQRHQTICSDIKESPQKSFRLLPKKLKMPTACYANYSKHDALAKSFFEERAPQRQAHSTTPVQHRLLCALKPCSKDSLAFFLNNIARKRVHYQSC